MSRVTTSLARNVWNKTRLTENIHRNCKTSHLNYSYAVNCLEYWQCCGKYQPIHQLQTLPFFILYIPNICIYVCLLKIHFAVCKINISTKKVNLSNICSMLWIFNSFTQKLEYHFVEKRTWIGRVQLALVTKLPVQRKAVSGYPRMTTIQPARNTLIEQYLYLGKVLV